MNIIRDIPEDEVHLFSRFEAAGFVLHPEGEGPVDRSRVDGLLDAHLEREYAEFEDEQHRFGHRASRVEIGRESHDRARVDELAGRGAFLLHQEERYAGQHCRDRVARGEGRDPGVGYGDQVVG